MYDYQLDDAGISHLSEDEEDSKRREVRKLLILAVSRNNCKFIYRNEIHF